MTVLDYTSKKVQSPTVGAAIQRDDTYLPRTDFGPIPNQSRTNWSEINLIRTVFGPT